MAEGVRADIHSGETEGAQALWPPISTPMISCLRIAVCGLVECVVLKKKTLLKY